MKMTGMLTKKLTGFWLMSLVAVAFVFLLTALTSFVQLSYRAQQHKVETLEQVLLSHHHQDASQLDEWLSPLLSAYDAAELRLYQNDTLHYEYLSSSPKTNLIEYERYLDRARTLRLYLALPQPFDSHQVGIYEVMIVLVGSLAVLLFVRFGFNWFSQQLYGVEELSARSHLILKGKFEKAAEKKGSGKPRIINRALTRLLEELIDAKKERSRFDKFIRSNTFLDTETRIGNRLFFKNRLDALSSHQGMMGHGVLYLLEMEDIDFLQQQLGHELVSELLIANVSGINQLLHSQPGSIFARRSTNQFAIVIPQVSLKEADQLAVKLLKVCLSNLLQEGKQGESTYYIGGAYFKAGDDKIQLLEEADMALKAAQLQGSSNWFIYDKGVIDSELAKGSVRWRSFLENSLVEQRFVAFTQDVVNSEELIDHKEVFTRVRDRSNQLVRATLFIPMAVKCGLMPQIERRIIENVLFSLLTKRENQHATYSINLSLDSLKSRAFVRWLQTSLLEQRHLAERLIFEVSESVVVQHQDALEPTLNMIRKMGAKLCVDHVGLQVVSTQYIKQLHFDQIKLHRAVVRQIHLRQENQLFVRSLVAGLYRTQVQVLAEGVEEEGEWQTLQALGIIAAQGSFFNDPQEVV
ncbi:RNase E specificity factor CsrD [Shewanella gelidii]|uniref:RNase E specificity factor CsrD n=1 Tax=Shewanella gelidii TaxID=1642821 RepID=A0A917JUW3_9GAMM|nr:RNase E specificity factor CsrD [Shewanella gelidii]MCL1098744.1 RNase E specificity factor CsrD [Shewanella gelidii]GGI87942.1 RNase E specificity factor CsrD [Shewanella gelidii]